MSVGEQVKTTYREAMRAAIREALQRDDRVFLMGEDVGRYGGCFAVSLGLLEVFGPERIRDTPLSESAFVGAGIGAAMAGMRPIVEIMTVNFSLLALDQIMNNAATLLHMSGGQCNVPLVVAAWLLRLGLVADLLSKPVLVGYMAGVALIMIADQLQHVTGVPVTGQVFFAQVGSFARGLGHVQPTVLAVSLAVLGFLLLLRWRWPRLPGPLLAVLLAFRRTELLIAVATFLGVLVFDILYGVLIAIGLSVADVRPGPR